MDAKALALVKDHLINVKTKIFIQRRSVKRASLAKIKSNLAFSKSLNDEDLLELKIVI